jgi:DNA (cytosine-5)-methyltransferase 1
MEAAIVVPPGGNWKNIPESVPLARLDTIRRGFAEGRGSRSTYYGRLRPDRPSYTINTHFTRPGNGCHLHYDFEGGQHRTLSLREAARLQSFPDSFVFLGPRSSITKQIGNAVPPLLAYQLAKAIRPRGMFVDLFAGAGGLGLGFDWAGWKPIVASDIDANFLSTHERNIRCPVIVGDLTDPQVVREISRAVSRARKEFPDLPLWILGGPPCQGFSTAGKRRTMDDERNHLFRDYADLVRSLRPNGFIFENVMGLLNMENGSIFKMVRETLAEAAPFVEHFVLHAEQHGVPQRRSRIIILGYERVHPFPGAPPQITSLDESGNLFNTFAPAVSVHDAISDLPALGNGENGEDFDYISEPTTNFQRLMRGRMTPAAYITQLRRFDRCGS